MVLSGNKKPSDQLNWSIEGDFIMQSCCLFGKTWREDKLKLCASARDSSNFAILFIIYTPKFIHWKGAKLISIHKPVEKAESQSNGAYHTFHVWEKRYVQSGTTYHQRYAFETVRKVIIQNPLAGMFSHIILHFFLRIWEKSPSAWPCSVGDKKTQT